MGAPRGVPQIEVCFDIDANGIMNIAAKDKSNGNTKNMTVEKNKRNLDERDVERLAAEAEKYKAEDEAVRARLDARNGLESFAYNLKQSVNDDGLKDKVAQADKDTLLAKEEFEAKQKELQEVSAPIMSKAYQAGGGASASAAGPDGMEGTAGAAKPNI